MSEKNDVSVDIDSIGGLWVEQFRPKSISDVIMPEPYRNAFEKYVKSGNMQNVILFSPEPGSGKTSLAKAIVNDLGCEYKFINASLDNGIDIIREEVHKFAQYESFDGNPKVVILDEFDGSSVQMQKALKTFIEQYHEDCRFIVTCNSMVNIIKPLQSRCKIFDFNFNKPQFKQEILGLTYRRVATILKIVGVEYDKAALETIVVNNFPDIRATLQVCSQAYDMYGGVTPDACYIEPYDDRLLQWILDGKISNAKEYMRTHGDYTGVFTHLLNSLEKMNNIEYEVQFIPVIAKYMENESRGVISSYINFYAMCIELGIIARRAQNYA